jgi:hypothetical protein
MSFAVDHEASASSEQTPVISFEQFAKPGFVGRLQFAVAANDSLEKTVCPRQVNQGVEFHVLSGEYFHQLAHV